MKKYTKRSLLLTIAIVLLFFSKVKAEEYTDKEIVEAIWHTEGGAKAKVAYGILSVKVKDKKEARQICFNTVRNQRKRHANHKCGLDFLSCLARRYAPINCNNDNGTNKFWLKNLKYFLAKKKGLSNG